MEPFTEEAWSNQSYGMPSFLFSIVSSTLIYYPVHPPYLTCSACEGAPYNILVPGGLK